MEAIVPWLALCEVIEPSYTMAGNGRPPIGLDRMLRIQFIQHGFNLADLAWRRGAICQGRTRTAVPRLQGQHPDHRGCRHHRCAQLDQGRG